MIPRDLPLEKNFGRGFPVADVSCAGPFFKFFIYCSSYFKKREKRGRNEVDSLRCRYAGNRRVQSLRGAWFVKTLQSGENHENKRIMKKRGEVRGAGGCLAAAVPAYCWIWIVQCAVYIAGPGGWLARFGCKAPACLMWQHTKRQGGTCPHKQAYESIPGMSSSMFVWHLGWRA